VTLSEKVPTGQMEQIILLASASWWISNPGSQMQSVIWVLPIGEVELLGHGIHAVSDIEPDTLLKVLALHIVQSNSENAPTTLENLPASQWLHVVAFTVDE